MTTITQDVLSLLQEHSVYDHVKGEVILKKTVKGFVRGEVLFDKAGFVSPSLKDEIATFPDLAINPSFPWLPDWRFKPKTLASFENVVCSRCGSKKFVYDGKCYSKHMSGYIKKRVRCLSCGYTFRIHNVHIGMAPKMKTPERVIRYAILQCAKYSYRDVALLILEKFGIIRSPTTVCHWVLKTKLERKKIAKNHLEASKKRKLITLKNKLTMGSSLAKKEISNDELRCPHCDSPFVIKDGKNFKNHGKKRRFPLQKYRCKACQRYFTQHL